MKKITVENFNDFSGCIKEYREAVEKKSNDAKKIYFPVFRGVHEAQGLGRYLKPSLDWNNLVKYEYDLIDEMERLRPLEFNHLNGNLDIIGKCQHYGLPTRLLDFTKSEYVALFFAINAINEEFNENDVSKIYCMAANLRDDAIAEQTARIGLKMQSWMYDNDEETNHNFIENILFLTKGDDLTKKIHDYIKRTMKSPIFTYPKFYTIREQNQQSVFLIFPNKIGGTKTESINFSSNDWWETSLGRDTCASRFIFQPELYNPLENLSNEASELFWEISIKKEAREEMKSKLELLGINSAFLFADNLEYATKEIKRRLKESIMQK
ncbi:MAG: FRG domain-containing protein [Candidatus Coproplasma sp.]